MMRSFPVVFLSCLVVSTTRAFVNIQGVHRQQSLSTKASRLFVFERLSEECIQAVAKGQALANQYQCEHVNNVHAVVGCLEQTQSAALKRTLTQYQITHRRVSQQLEQHYKSADTENNNNAGWLAGFRAAKSNQEDRPFGNDMKRTLRQAAAVADQMSDPVIETHHVFLSLLGYSSGSATTTEEDNEAWNLLQQACAVNATASQVCESLLGHLQQQQQNDNNGRELVTGVGASSSATPTLAQVAVDLTQQAQDGLLDPVYGRDGEIRACLRTLLRRRKNNVCLIGEPGVGKVRVSFVLLSIVHC